MKVRRRHIWVRISAAVLCLSVAGPALPANSRLKDISHIAGVRSNAVIGYGLVIGLNGTGDRQQTFFTNQTLINMLERFGLTMNNPAIRVQNIAAVMVTSELPAFTRAGSRIDVTVSSIGDAASLQGGILLQTPLLGPDGDVFAMSQGPLVIGGFSAGNDATGVSVNHPTVGRIPNGAMVERTVMAGMPEVVQRLELILDRADFTNASRVTAAVNSAFGVLIAHPLDSRSVRLELPADYQNRPIEFIAAIEAVSVEIDTTARVVVNERTGTIVIGSEVRIAPVSISHGNLSIQIQTQFDVSQPNGFSDGQTVVVPQQQLTVQEDESGFVTLDDGATVEDLIGALNALGVTPRDTIAILEALKVAGALQADLEII